MFFLRKRQVGNFTLRATLQLCKKTKEVFLIISAGAFDVAEFCESFLILLHVFLTLCGPTTSQECKTFLCNPDQVHPWDVLRN